MDLINDSKCKYLYCIAECPGTWPSKVVGVEGNLVYPVGYRDIAAIVHDCAEKPYNSDDNNVVTGWVLGHQEVVDQACRYYSNVLPFTFNSIIKGKDALNPNEQLIKWLKENYEHFKCKFEKFKDKKEYVVQVVLDSQVIVSELLQTNSDILQLQAEAAGSTKGKSFLIREKINKKLKDLVAAQADSYFHEFCQKICSTVSESKMCKIRPPEQNHIMIINLACLASELEARVLGEVLEKIKKENTGIIIKFSGPWPVYSFM